MVLLGNQHSIWQEVPVSEYNVSAEEIPLSPIFVLMGVGCLILFLFKPSGWMKKTECIPSFRHAYFLSRCLVGWQLNSWLCLNALCIELQLDVLLILFLFSKCAETPCTPVCLICLCIHKFTVMVGCPDHLSTKDQTCFYPTFTVYLWRSPAIRFW